MYDKDVLETANVGENKTILFSKEGPFSDGVKACLCIPCAVETADFKERAPAAGGETFDTLLIARAWINGRSYWLSQHPVVRSTCGRCGRHTHAAYVPEELLVA